MGVLRGFVLTAVGLPVAGSWSFGLAWTATGVAFAAISAVTNQLTSSARVATSVAMIVLALAYLMRAVGDVTGTTENPSVLSWLSPVGWGQQVRPYAGDRGVVLLLPVAFAVVALALAYALQSRRDLGAGLLPDRAGRAAAGCRDYWSTGARRGSPYSTANTFSGSGLPRTVMGGIARALNAAAPPARW